MIDMVWPDKVKDFLITYFCLFLLGPWLGSYIYNKTAHGTIGIPTSQLVSVPGQVTGFIGYLLL